MKDGFYWCKFIDDLPIDGGRAGVALVRDGMGYMFGFGLLLTAFDFGDNPEPITPPTWLIESLQPK